MQNEIAKFVEDDEPTIVIREDQYCPICDCYNGHSLSCATFRFNRIEGHVSKGVEPPLQIEISTITNNEENVVMVTVSDANVREAINDLERQTGVRLSFEQMQGLLRSLRTSISSSKTSAKSKRRFVKRSLTPWQSSLSAATGR